jgi:hypothetical protein
MCDARPIRLQLSRKKGWRMPENTVKVDRSTPWGNPYATHKNGYSKENDFWLHRSALIDDDTPLSDSDIGEQAAKWRTWVRANIHELRGKNLACWCRLPEPYDRDKCHAATLLELANQDQP